MAYFDHMKDEIKREAKKKWGYDLPDKRIEPVQSGSGSYGGSGSGKSYEFLRQKAIEARDELKQIKENVKKEDFIPKGDVKENPIIDARDSKERGENPVSQPLDLQNQIQQTERSSMFQNIDEDNDFEDEKPSIKFDEEDSFGSSREEVKKSFFDDSEDNFPQKKESVFSTSSNSDFGENEISVLKQIRDQNIKVIELLKRIADRGSF